MKYIIRGLRCKRYTKSQVTVLKTFNDVLLILRDLNEIGSSTCDTYANCRATPMLKRTRLIQPFECLFTVIKHHKYVVNLITGTG